MKKILFLLCLLPFAAAAQRVINTTEYTRDLLRSQTAAAARSNLGLIDTNAATLDAAEAAITPSTTMAETDLFRFIDSTNAAAITLPNAREALMDGATSSSSPRHTDAFAARVDGSWRMLSVSNVEPRYNAKWYGATGDGATADNVAISAAITAAAADGGTVYLPAGTYFLTNALSLSNNVALIGAGRAETTLLLSSNAADGTSLVTLSGVTNLLLSDLTLDGHWRNRGLSPSTSENNGINVYANSSDVVFRNVRVSDVGKDGINFNASARAWIDQCEFEDCGDAGVASETADLWISGTLFTNCGWVLQDAGTHVGGIGDVNSSRMHVSGCTFVNNYQSIYKQGGPNYVFANNVFEQTNSARTNIVLVGTSKGLITGNVFHQGMGIWIQSTLLQVLEVNANVFNTHYGILANNGEHVTIRGNTFNNLALSPSWGVNVTAAVAGRFHILDNTFHVGAAAITLGDGVNGVQVRNNVVSAGSASTVMLNGTGSSHTIEGNRVDVSAFDNLNLGTGTNCSVRFNRFAGTLRLTGSNNIVAANLIKDVYLNTAASKSNVFQGNILSGNVTGSGDYMGQNYWWDNTKANRQPLSLSGSLTTLTEDYFPQPVEFGSNVTAVAFFGDGSNLTGVTGSGDVSAASNFGTDNVLIRSDGTGKGVQSSGITIDDSDNMSGVSSLTVSNVVRLSSTLSPASAATNFTLTAYPSRQFLFSADTNAHLTLGAIAAGQEWTVFVDALTSSVPCIVSFSDGLIKNTNAVLTVPAGQLMPVSFYARDTSPTNCVVALGGLFSR